MQRFPKVLVGLGIGCLLFLGAGFSQVGAQVLWQAFEAMVRLTGPPLPASRGVLSDNEIEELDHLTPQIQAERLLLRAVNQYHGAAQLIEQRVDTWRGHLDHNKQLETLIWSALNSSDLRVRAAAAEISLAAYGLEKVPATAELKSTWFFGRCGSSSTTRTKKLENGPSIRSQCWAKAACSLAETGMLTRQQRQQAVPDFLLLAEDHSLPPVARRWAFQALRDITGQQIQNDPTAWRNWADTAGF